MPPVMKGIPALVGVQGIRRRSVRVFLQAPRRRLLRHGFEDRHEGRSATVSPCGDDLHPAGAQSVHDPLGVDRGDVPIGAPPCHPGGEGLSSSGILLGTPAYTSPEQAGGSRVLDGRSDIYSLGCVLYEMLGGEPPFSGATRVAVLARHLAGVVPPLRTLQPNVPPVRARRAPGFGQTAEGALRDGRGDGGRPAGGVRRKFIVRSSVMAPPGASAGPTFERCPSPCLQPRTPTDPGSASGPWARPR